MRAQLRTFWLAYWGLTALLFVGAGAMAAFYAPIEASMGTVQKIFYLHLPTALCMFGAGAVVFGASIAYLWQRSQRWDDWAHAAAHGHAQPRGSAHRRAL